jgi:two-component system cell cycle sensor histidine kinase/response regulator CckA
MGRPLRVLMVEDSEDDELLLLRALRRGSYEPTAKRVETAAAMKAALDGGEWDLVLSDYSMPYFSAPAALALLQESGLDLPFIIVSGAIGEETAVEAMRVGAHDYVSKDNLARLTPAIERELRDAEVRRERQRAEEALRESERRAREQAHQVQQIIRTVPEGVLLLDTSLRVLLVNPAAQEYLAVLADARVGEPLDRLGGRPVAELLAPPPRGLWHEVGVNGSLQPRAFEVIAQSIEAGPEAEGWVLVIRDVTEEREVRQVVQRQERLAAVGQLAAGIAHDFNNIMTSIILYAGMMSKSPNLSPLYWRYLETIRQQGRRAAELIQQILDFSRQSMMERHSLNLLPFLKELEKLLTRTFPENVHLHLDYDHEYYFVDADLTRMQQVIMNLALNARDAMPEGGDLYIKLSRVQIRPDGRPPCPGMAAGEWVCMSVSDTGTGIPPEIRPRIFEPFFTTKPPGQGTGLGLAQVYGIVEQHEGHIRVDSQVGRGTTFAIYLPALGTYQAGELVQEERALAEGCGETILLVEDNAIAREALREGLEQLNYHVFEAGNGRDALAIYRSVDDIDLVITDMIMPEMGGRELVQELRKLNPGVGVVVVTGYVLAEALQALKEDGPLEIVRKPIDVNTLSEIIRQALEGD